MLDSGGCFAKLFDVASFYVPFLVYLHFIVQWCVLSASIAYPPRIAAKNLALQDYRNENIVMPQEVTY